MFAVVSGYFWAEEGGREEGEEEEGQEWVMLDNPETEKLYASSVAHMVMACPVPGLSSVSHAAPASPSSCAASPSAHKVFGPLRPPVTISTQTYRPRPAALVALGGSDGEEEKEEEEEEGYKPRPAALVDLGGDSSREVEMEVEMEEEVEEALWPQPWSPARALQCGPRPLAITFQEKPPLTLTSPRPATTVLDFLLNCLPFPEDEEEEDEEEEMTFPFPSTMEDVKEVLLHLHSPSVAKRSPASLSSSPLPLPSPTKEEEEEEEEDEWEEEDCGYRRMKMRSKRCNMAKRKLPILRSYFS